MLTNLLRDAILVETRGTSVLPDFNEGACIMMSFDCLRRFAKVTASVALGILASASVGLCAQWSMGPVNPEFVKYMKSEKVQAAQAKCQNISDRTSRPLGYKPAPVNMSHVRGKDILPFLMNASRELVAGRALSLPSQYDLRTSNLVTPIRDQDPYGTCWAFASLASLESTLLKETSVINDFSEWHLAYFAYVDEAADLPAFSTCEVGENEDVIFDQGGNIWRAAAILARGTGAVAEADCPYQHVNPWPKESRPQASAPIAKRLEEMLFLGRDFNAELIKKELMENGAIAFRMQWKDAAYNEETASYYNSDKEAGGGHIVTLIGWNDDYPAASFKENPGSAGAWLVKNSWGSAFGDEGYFWISYQDATLGYPAVFRGISTNTFDRIYQYDPLGKVSSWGYEDDTAWFANVFSSQGFDDAQAEVLSAVAFYTTGVNASYALEVWGGGEAGNLKSGELKAQQSGNIAIPGYHTIYLETPVNLPVGSSFAVVVRMTTPGYIYPVAIERPKEEYSEKATARAGESYVSLDGRNWEDMTTNIANTNVCLKAFSKKLNEPTPTPTPTPTPIPAGGRGGGCSAGFTPSILVLALPLMFSRR